MNQELYYQRSSGFTIPGLLMMVVGGAAAGGVLGIPYGYAVHYCPLIYINLFITAFYGCAVGIAVGGLGRAGKIRNLPLILLVAVASAVFAEYMAWVGYLNALASVWLWSPEQMLKAILVLNEKGAWTLRGSTPTGLVLWAVWAIEFGAILYFSCLLPYQGIGSTPFNDQANAWAEGKDEFGPFALTADADDVVRRFESGDTGVASNLKLLPIGSRTGHTCTVRSCAADPAFLLLSLDSFIKTQDKNGKEKTRTTSVIRHLFVTAEMVAAVAAKAAEKPPAVAAPAAPVAPAPSGLVPVDDKPE